MSENKDKKSGPQESIQPKEAPTKRYGRSRRDLLKQLAIGGAVIGGASQTLPKKWMKPVVDSIVVPVHAQATGGAINAFWIIGDDAPGGADVGIGVGTTSAAATAPNGDYLYDDGTDMTLYGTLVPPAGVTVSASGVVSGTTYGAPSFGATDAVADPGSGAFSFGSYSPSNDDFGDTPGTGTITITVSAPGYANSVIVLNVDFVA